VPLLSLHTKGINSHLYKALSSWTDLVKVVKTLKKLRGTENARPRTLNLQFLMPFCRCFLNMITLRETKSPGQVSVVLPWVSMESSIVIKKKSGKWLDSTRCSPGSGTRVQRRTNNDLAHRRGRRQKNLRVEEELGEPRSGGDQHGVARTA
jgi:hypothetical protein